MTPDSELNPALGADGQPDTLSATNAEPARTESKSNNRIVREVVETLLLAALIFFLVRLVVLNFRVDGASMVPNLENGQMLLVNRNAYHHFDINGSRYYPFDPPERGDVIVFDPPTNSEKPYIKRIIGLPGEEVTFGDGHVLIDGVPLEEAYIEDRTRCGRSETCDVVVPEGNIYVLGDNRNNSSDSRVFGPVPVDNVIGKAWVSYWPPGDFGFVPHESYAADESEPAAAS